MQVTWHLARSVTNLISPYLSLKCACTELVSCDSKYAFLHKLKQSQLNPPGEILDVTDVQSLETRTFGVNFTLAVGAHSNCVLNFYLNNAISFKTVVFDIGLERDQIGYWSSLQSTLNDRYPGPAPSNNGLASAVPILTSSSLSLASFSTFSTVETPTDPAAPSPTTSTIIGVTQPPATASTGPGDVDASHLSIFLEGETNQYAAGLEYTGCLRDNETMKASCWSLLQIPAWLPVWLKQYWPCALNRTCGNLNTWPTQFLTHVLGSSGPECSSLDAGQCQEPPFRKHVNAEPLQRLLFARYKYVSYNIARKSMSLYPFD